MMALPFCHVHGPEHHVMVGAALLTAYKNARGDVDLAAALTEMMNRGESVPGGAATTEEVSAIEAEYVGRYAFYHCFETPNMHWLDAPRTARPCGRSAWTSCRITGGGASRLR